jgi:hypothetical protein
MDQVNRFLKLEIMRRRNVANENDADDASDTSNTIRGGKEKPRHPPQSAQRLAVQVMIAVTLVGGLFYAKQIHVGKSRKKDGDGKIPCSLRDIS